MASTLALTAREGVLLDAEAFALLTALKVLFWSVGIGFNGTDPEFAAGIGIGTGGDGGIGSGLPRRSKS